MDEAADARNVIHSSEVTKPAQLLTLYPKIISWWIKGIHWKGKTLQLLENNTEYFPGSVLLTNCKTKIHKFTHVNTNISCLSKDYGGGGQH